MIKNYINLIKPNIVIGNLMSSIGGFLMASHGHINFFNLFNMSIGMTLIIASSCILNNIIDHDIDAVMQRTKNRILSKNHNIFFIKKIMFYAVLLNIFGFLFLERIKNLLIILLSIIAIIIYIGIYSLWTKRKSIYSPIIGSISGSMPPIIGYCTVSQQLDIGAYILLLIYSFWQIPHFYSITIFCSQDYSTAKIPTFFIKKGIKTTRIHMTICIIIFTIATASLTITKYTSDIFLYITSIINLFWLYINFKYRSINDNLIWSRKMFILSIIVITSLNILLLFDSFYLYKLYK